MFIYFQFWCVLCGHFQNVVHLVKWKHSLIAKNIESSLNNLSLDEDQKSTGTPDSYSDRGGGDSGDVDETKDNQLTVLSK